MSIGNHGFVLDLILTGIWNDFNFSIKLINKRQRISMGQSQMDNPEKLATQGAQDDEKQKKNTTQYALDITVRKQTQIS